MQISRVRLNNFRQFYGQQELEFPTTGDKNVTLIHAENADFLSFESAKSAFFCVQKALCKVIRFCG